MTGYTLLREIGRGGMAIVYLAEQHSLGREVALKVMSPGSDQDPTLVERFMREARIAANLRHPHIVAIHDFGVHAGRPFIAMDYEPGGSVLPPRGECLEPRSALRIVRDIADALDYAHGRGVVHRDIKPDNILRRPDGAAMLSDFGIARMMHGESVLTAEGTSVGTPHYMSPEQLRGDKVDGRSDIYSLGVVLWQLLTGELPYTGADVWAIGAQHVSSDVPRLPPSLTHLQALVDSLMAKSVEARIQTGAELMRCIDGVLSTSVAPATAPKIPTAIGRLRGDAAAWRFGLVGLLMMLVLVVAWLGWRQFGRAASDDAGALLAPPTAAPSGPAMAGAAQASSALAPVDQSIAVLPFVNMSADKDNVYFSDGLAETLLDMLAQVSTLKVTARTSSFVFRDKAVDVRAIGKALGVAHVLEGSVQKSGQNVRITAQLIRASDGVHLWSKRYDRKLTDVFRIQDEIATEVVESLKVVMAGEDRSRLTRTRTENLQAYDEYLKGIALLRLRAVGKMREAGQHFERAIALDPGFSLAYVGAADTNRLLDVYSTVTPEDKAKEARNVKRALKLAPGSGEAHVANAHLLEYAQDYAGAEREYQRGLALAPNYVAGYHWYGWLLYSRLDRPAEALAQMDKALALDPLAPIIRLAHAITLAAAGDPQAGREELDALIASESDFPVGYFIRAYWAIEDGDLMTALRLMALSARADPDSSGNALARCEMLMHFDAFQEAHRCIDTVQKRAHGDPRIREYRAAMEMYRGNPKPALPVLTEPWTKHVHLLFMLGRDHDADVEIRRHVPEFFADQLPPLATLKGKKEEALAAGRALAKSGHIAQGQALVSRSLAADKIDNLARLPMVEVAYTVALLSTAGRIDEAVALLKRKADAGACADTSYIVVSPYSEALRADPRAPPLIAKLQACKANQRRLAQEAGLL